MTMTTYVAQPVKEITLYVGRNQRSYTKQVSPGETFGALMQSLGANPNDYLVFRPSDGQTFQNDDEVWEHIRDNDTIHLNLRSQVGFDFWQWLKNLLFQLFRRNAGNSVKVANVQFPSFVEVHGWKRRCNADGSILYSGRFSVSGLMTTWQGECLQRGSTFSFKIFRPPADLIKKTQWGACFQPIHNQPGWFSVHFHAPEPKDVDSGFAGIQFALQQTLLKAVGKEMR